MFREKVAKNVDILLFLLLVLLLVLGVVAWNYTRESSLIIQWTTESELDIAGFNLYRADEPDGEYRRINDQPISPAADPFIGGEYSFVDRDVTRGQTYYYVLEIIDRNGHTSRRQPVALRAN